MRVSEWRSCKHKILVTFLMSSHLLSTWMLKYCFSIGSIALQSTGPLHCPTGSLFGIIFFVIALQTCDSCRYQERKCHQNLRVCCRLQCQVSIALGRWSTLQLFLRNQETEIFQGAHQRQASLAWPMLQYAIAPLQRVMLQRVIVYIATLSACFPPCEQVI